MSNLAPVREATNTEGFERLARVGLATRAAIYLLIGWRRDRGLPPVTAEEGLEPEAAERLKPGA